LFFFILEFWPILFSDLLTLPYNFSPPRFFWTNKWEVFPKSQAIKGGCLLWTGHRSITRPFRLNSTPLLGIRFLPKIHFPSVFPPPLMPASNLPTLVRRGFFFVLNSPPFPFVDPTPKWPKTLTYLLTFFSFTQIPTFEAVTFSPLGHYIITPSTTLRAPPFSPVFFGLPS